MTVKLSKQQIQELYKFTRKHYVEWYDVQTELVDHLANAIEEQWSKNPKLSFEQALKNEFKKFGIFGFMEIVEERQKSLGKAYGKIILGFIKEWFTIPKVLITIFLIFGNYQLFTLPYGKYAYLTIQVLLLIIITYKFWTLTTYFKRKVEVTSKKWLLEEMIYKTQVANLFILMPTIINLSNFSETFSVIQAMIMSVLTVLIVLVAYITLEFIPKNAEELLVSTYPEYKMI